MLTILNNRGIYAPVVLCDVCGEEIKKHGMVKFNWEAKDPPLFCHKGNCDRPEDDKKRPLCHDLDVVLVWLVANTEINWKTAKVRAEWLARV